MLKTIKKILSLAFLNKHPGEPVEDAVVYLETEKGNVPLAFQVTGKSGGVTFAHLDKRVYKIIVSLPPQKDKLARQPNDIQENFQVAFHRRKKIFFIQENQGLFTLRFSGVCNLAGSNITPMHEIVPGNDQRIVIGKFEVDGKFGSVTMKISALKAKKFEKLVEKYKHDTEMSVILN
jgi:hypothetical protein